MNRAARIWKSHPIRFFVVIGLILWALAPQAYAQPATRYSIGDLKALEQSFIDLAEKARPPVVAIRAYQVRTFSEDDPPPSPLAKGGHRGVKVPISQGSGFVIDPNGLIATNGHVVENADRISVTLFDGSQYDAVIRQRDDRSDLAVLQVDAKNLPTVHWGDGSSLRVNQWVFACGNPFGMANLDGRSSITYGVVSALGREMTDRITENPQLHYYGNLIETSAAINPGSSGGPLFNLDGQIVGVVTAIETSSGVNEGMGFAIPIDANTRRILDTLRRGERVRYGFLGVSVDDVDPPLSRRVAETRRSRGARITSISPLDGPAASAGLQPDDVVFEFNGIPIDGKDQLVRVVGYTPVGTEAIVKYLRRQVERRTTVKVGDRLELLAGVDRRHDD